MKDLTKEHSGGRIVITDDNENEIDYSGIPDKVQEVCQNWFLKSSCIREVLPRIYLELCLVSSHKFMQRKVHQSDLVRLAKMLRGIAEPICNSYTCAYLARVGHDIDPYEKEYLLIMLEFCLKHWTNAHKNPNNKNMPKEEYFDLFEPAIDWIF